MTATYRAADGHSATLAQLIAGLRAMAQDLKAAADAGVAPDAAAARGLAGVIEHHCGQMDAAIEERPGEG